MTADGTKANILVPAMLSSLKLILNLFLPINNLWKYDNINTVMCFQVFSILQVYNVSVSAFQDSWHLDNREYLVSQ